MDGLKDIPLLPYGRLPSSEPLRVVPRRGPEASSEAARQPDEELVRLSVKDPEAAEKAPSDEPATKKGEQIDMVERRRELRQERREDNSERRAEAAERRETRRDERLDVEA
ncbi:MAG: hypothetical protein AAGB51_02170 [Planctomycetota bacterium]